VLGPRELSIEEGSRNGKPSEEITRNAAVLKPSGSGSVVDSNLIAARCRS